MDRAELEQSWTATRRHLAEAAQVLLDVGVPGDLGAFTECVEHNELELALDQLEQLAEQSRLSPKFWMHLSNAAAEMGLQDRVAYLRLQLAGAKSGYFEAVLALTETSEGGRRHPLMTGFRCPWDIGAQHEGKPTLNDAAVVILNRPHLPPGSTENVQLHPLVPELWTEVSLGQIVRPWESRFIGAAEITAAVPPWRPPEGQ